MSKKAIIYVRVSTDEQGEYGYSLPSQQEVLEKFCYSKGWEVVKVFSDDYTAWKGFNRPAYNELTRFLKANRGKVDTLLFTQWSRFSREYTYSVNEIKRLQDLGIEPNAVEQWIDFSIPENLFLLAIYITAPQVENDRLSQRTKAGMRQALKQGRWLWKAPFGYKNNQIERKIEIDEGTCGLVHSCFEMMGTGLYSAEDVRRKYKPEGLSLTKQGFLDMLQKVLYTGRIRISANKNEMEEIVEGNHQAIVSLELFAKVQSVLNGRKKSYKNITNNIETPLVGHLCCHKCDKLMTGSGSRGNGGIYHYYHCQRKYGCNNAFSSKKANVAFKVYLSSFQPKPEMIELYHAFLETQFKTGGSNRENEKRKLISEITLIDDRIKKAAFKNLDGVWDDALFSQTKDSLESQKNELKVKLNSLNTLTPEFTSYLSNSTTLMKNLSGFFMEAAIETKKKLIGSIFPEKIYFENNSYRTTKINEAIELVFNLSKGLNENSPEEYPRLSTVAPPVGLEPTTL